MNLRSALLENLTALEHIDANQSIESLIAFGNDEKKFLSVFKNVANTGLILLYALQVHDKTLRDIFLSFVLSEKYFNRIFNSSDCLNCVLTFISPEKKSSSVYNVSISDHFIDTVLMSPYLSNKFILALPENLLARKNQLIKKHGDYLAAFLFLSGTNENQSHLHMLNECMDVALKIVYYLILSQDGFLDLSDKSANKTIKNNLYIHSSKFFKTKENGSLRNSLCNNDETLVKDFKMLTI